MTGVLYLSVNWKPLTKNYLLAILAAADPFAKIANYFHRFSRRLATEDYKLFGNSATKSTFVAKFAITIYRSTLFSTAAIAAAVFLTAAKQKGAPSHPFTHLNLY